MSEMHSNQEEINKRKEQKTNSTEQSLSSQVTSLQASNKRKINTFHETQMIFTMKNSSF
jgi:hypothetical protein